MSPNFYDLHSVAEDNRIAAIGEAAKRSLVGVMLERDEPAKVTRYIRKVTERFPGVRLIDQTDGLVAALLEIAKGEGAFNRDPIKHAENTIDSMKAIARRALLAAGVET